MDPIRPEYVHEAMDEVSLLGDFMAAVTADATAAATALALGREVSRLAAAWGGHRGKAWLAEARTISAAVIAQGRKSGCRMGTSRA
ncbi:hypothetical protein JNX00_11080 [Hydrogenophaga sp. YM1]|uniref:hypothetical protein n=1 Tax=Hydrogenophaga sp. YM1 TaxID=2806262 RepID=UPI00195AA56B|nr:hypothetical protein [Hydrogenophaga sp. YM1]QRR32237.1 hypothetical protein JNX00_11080 [Hydrogenophaga sp. YM1]